MPINLPTNLLRNFVAIVETGSMLSASNQVYVTQSALSLQIKRLEDMVQQALFIRDGRRLQLSEAGEILLDYARRLLALHDEAVLAVTSGAYAGSIRVGTIQDFADTILSTLLGQFASLHPEAQIYAKVAGTVELQAMLERDQIDLFIGYAAADDPGALHIAPMAWYGHPDLAGLETVPLAVLEKPCRFREAAIASLEAAGRSYRIAVETPNLSSLRAALEAGLGITCRTSLFLNSETSPLEAGLPALPQVAMIVGRRRGLDRAPAKLAELAINAVRRID